MAENEFIAHDNGPIEIGSSNHVNSFFVDAINAIAVGDHLAKISFFQGAPPRQGAPDDSNFSTFQLVMSRESFDLLQQALSEMDQKMKEQRNG